MLKNLSEIYAENSKNKTIDEKKYQVRFSKLKLRRFAAKSVLYRENVRSIATMVIGANWKEAIWLGV